MRYTGSSELGETATIVGFGMTGTGLTGDTLAAGTKRAGQNVLDVLGSSAGHPSLTYPDDYLIADFDRPGVPSESSYGSSTPLALEYSSGSGDSGGGVFITVAGQTRLAGVVSFGATGPIAAPDASPNSDYGDLMGFTRVSQFNAWIDDQTSAIYWGSAASGSFADTARWADGLAPGAAHIAVFKTAGTFTATLPADTANKRLRVRTGTVTLDLAGHTYTLAATAAERSILVGQVSGDTASLTFTGGTVTAVDASLGEASGATGSLRLTGAGTSLVLSGSLGVGGSPTATAGTGTFMVENSTSE